MPKLQVLRMWYLLNDVAKACGVDPQTVLYWHKHGKLVPSARTPRGVRLYDPRTVERFKQQRQKNTRDQGQRP